MNDVDLMNLKTMLALLHAKLDQLMEWNEPADWKERLKSDQPPTSLGDRAAAYERALFGNRLWPEQNPSDDR
jgi:hypothetical protein